MRRFFFIGLGALALCGATRNLSIHNVPPSDAEKLLTDVGVYLLDVRTTKEFDEGHIPNANLIPLKDLSSRLKEMPADKTQPILVYGSTAERSAKAAKILYWDDHKDIYVLSGGLSAWIAAQKPVQVSPSHGKTAPTPGKRP